MDFVTHLPWTPRRHNAIWVIVDQLTKSAHFLAVRMTFTLEELCRLYILEIVCVRPEKNSNFLKKGKIVISAKNPEFF